MTARDGSRARAHFAPIREQAMIQVHHQDEQDLRWWADDDYDAMKRRGEAVEVGNLFSRGHGRGKPAR